MKRALLLPALVAGVALAAQPQAGVDEKALDPAANPCEDFYQYACGGWLKNTAIPADKSTWDISFSVLEETNRAELRAILDEIAAGKMKDLPYAEKLGAFWTSCMDEAAIEKTTPGELKTLLGRIDQVKTPEDLARTVAWMHLSVAAPMFSFGSQQDYKNATQVIGSMDQGGLGLPDRDYYTENDPKTKQIRAQYEVMMKKLMTLAGATPAQANKDAATVMRIETALARVSIPRVDRRDPKKIYHRLDLAGLEKLAPRFPWRTYLKEIGSGEVTQINVAVPAFFTGLNKQLGTVSMADWRTYLRWQTLLEGAELWSKPFVDAHFAFTKALIGQAEIEPRWKRCVIATDHALGEALGQAYVQRAFGPDLKNDTVGMVKAIEAAMEDNLKSLPWMDDVTRKRAFEKLHAVNNKIGYPDKWRNYDKARVAAGMSYYAASSAASEFETRRELDKIGKPLDRSEWLSTPPTVNAYYDPSLNEMVFPAGILQPPFYGGKKLPAAMSWGGIGLVMGHELTHGFDDEGRQFDARGNLSDWWSPKVNEAFEKRAQCVVDQYSDYTAIDDIKLDGKLTEGENIADLGGLKLAWNAYRGAKVSPSKGKYSDDQLFFLGFAQSWCGKRRDEYARLAVKVDSHSPEQFRVNGPLANFAPFAAAFQCKPGQKMVRATACAVW